MMPINFTEISFGKDCHFYSCTTEDISTHFYMRVAGEIVKNCNVSAIWFFNDVSCNLMSIFSRGLLIKLRFPPEMQIDGRSGTDRSSWHSSEVARHKFMRVNGNLAWGKGDHSNLSLIRTKWKTNAVVLFIYELIWARVFLLPLKYNF